MLCLSKYSLFNAEIFLVNFLAISWINLKTGLNHSFFRSADHKKHGKDHKHKHSSSEEQTTTTTTAEATTEQTVTVAIAKRYKYLFHFYLNIGRKWDLMFGKDYPAILIIIVESVL